MPSTDFTPPEPPPGLDIISIDRTTGTAQLTWNPSPSADRSGYRVYRQGPLGPRSPITALLFAPQFEDRTLPDEGTFSYSVTAIDLAGNESDWSNIAPAPLDFFGSVLELRRSFTVGGTLSVNTSRGRVDVEIASDTEIRVPNRTDARLGDLDLGDHVAVSLKEDAEGTVARQVHLVPSKTRNRHLAGRVAVLSESEIVIQPRGDGTDPVTFQLSANVQVNLHQGVTGLEEGRFVVVSFIATGQPVRRCAKRDKRHSGAGAGGGIANASRGAHKRCGHPRYSPRDHPDNANLILSSTEVAIDVYTVMTAGVSVGDAVLIEAVLRPDGSLLARKVEHDEGVGRTAARTVLRGVFEGRDVLPANGRSAVPR